MGHDLSTTAATVRRNAHSPGTRTLNLGFLSPHNPYDFTAFSGTAAHAAKALAQDPLINLRILGGHRKRRFLDRVFRPQSERCMPCVTDLAGLDAVLGLVATPLLDRLGDLTGLPLIHVTDATPGFLRDVYGWTIAEGAFLAEQRVVRKVAATVYSSRYMADWAELEMDFGGRPPLSARFGVNMDDLPGRPPEKPAPDPLNLLLVASDWERKGGDMAVATLDRLRGLGIRCELVVVGTPPAGLSNHPGVVCLGFLDKNRQRDRVMLGRAFTQAHVFLLPSRADCTPMVLGEAMMHGTTVVATDTGAISEILGPSGTYSHLMAPTANPADWAEAVLDLAGNPLRYARHSRLAYRRAQEMLSWDLWARSIGRIARSVIETPGAAAA